MIRLNRIYLENFMRLRNIEEQKKFFSDEKLYLVKNSGKGISLGQIRCFWYGVKFIENISNQEILLVTEKIKDTEKEIYEIEYSDDDKFTNTENLLI